MPKIIKNFLLEILPRLLCMSKPKPEDNPRTGVIDYSKIASQWIDPTHYYNGHINGRGSIVSTTFIGPPPLDNDIDLTVICQACSARQNRIIPIQAYKALEGVAYVEKHMRDEDEGTKVKLKPHFYLYVYKYMCISVS